MENTRYSDLDQVSPGSHLDDNGNESNVENVEKCGENEEKMNYIMVDCPRCDGSGTLDRLAADRYVGCPDCHATGEIEVEEEVEQSAQDCLECLGPCDDGGRDSLGTCGSERCRRRAMQADAQEYEGGE